MTHGRAGAGKVAAIITARGGSKGIPGKNLRTVAGRTLVEHAVEAARACAAIGEIAVTTDDAAIADEARRLGARVVDRPAALAGDESSSADAVVHALQALAAAGVRPQTGVLLQPTSPLRTAAHLDESLRLYESSGARSVVSAARAAAHPWKVLLADGDAVWPVEGWAALEQPRQALPAAFRPNGAIYVFDVAAFLSERRFFLEPMRLFEMSPEDSVDIDGEDDLALAEEALRRRLLAPRWPGATLAFSKAVDMRRLNRTPAWRREIAADQAALSARVAPHRRRRGGCPVCGTAEAAPFVTIFSFEYAECAGCGHLYSRTPPDEAALARLYDGGPGEDRSVQHKIYMDPEVYQRRVKEIALPKVAHVGRLARGRGRWIDVGCGAGEVVRAAAQAGWRASGIESDAAEAAFARRMGAEVTEGFVTRENAPALLREAQVVSFFNVLEHVAEPRELLSGVAQALSPGALVVAEVPHHPSISSLGNRLFPQMACRHIYPPDHLHVFTDASFARLAGDAGLRPVGIWYFGQDVFDLVCSAAAAAGMDSTPLYERVVDLAPAMQGVVDRAGLADTLLAVCERA